MNENEKPAVIDRRYNNELVPAPATADRGARYRLLEKLGAGGMGEVWRARDTKLNRDVALKFLPEDLASDQKALDRFRREAQLASSLNHPHICAVYDTGELDGRQFISMELVEGETLAARLAKPLTPGPSPQGRGERYKDAKSQPSPLGRGWPRRAGTGEGSPLPMDTVLEYGIEIAGALTAAHRLGIIHRDLKPQNIMLTKSGTKLLDFGLAKLTRGTGVSPVALGEHGQAPTQSLGSPSRATVDAESITAQGAIMGTLHYMAPEQLEGKPADSRSDIFAFGCVLYEMATGKRAFEGESSAQVMAAIMKNDPPPMVGAGLVPALGQPPQAGSSPSKGHPQGVPLQRVVMKCLAKDPDDRWQTASDLCDELKWIKEGVGAGTGTPGYALGALPSPGQEGTASRAPTKALPWAAAIVLTAILTGLIVWHLVTPQATSPRLVTRFAITLPSGDELANLESPSVALSPDGSNLVYVARHDKVTQLYLRPLDQLEAKPLAGTEGATCPFFSPDGQWIGFLAGWTLNKISLKGGPPITILRNRTPLDYGASWGSDDTIIFSTAPGSLLQVSASGGTPRPVTDVNHRQGERRHGWPQILPGGEVLFNVLTGENWDEARIEIFSPKTGERHTLAVSGARPHYVAAGAIVFERGGDLMAVPFDLKALKVTGPPAPVLKGVRMDSTSGGAQFSISSKGSLAYIPGGISTQESTLVWVDRKGKEEPLPAPARQYSFPRVSPDGSRVAVQIGEPDGDIWVYDVARQTLTRLTTDGTNRRFVWTADGKRVAYGSVRESGRNIYWAYPDGSGEERLTAGDGINFPYSFSPDGRLLAYYGDGPQASDPNGIWIVPLAGDRKPQFFRPGSVPVFSPDGHWIAYSYCDGGSCQLYVAPYPGPGEQQQVSVNGGWQSRWSPNGREILWGGDGKVRAASVTPAGSTLKLGKPQVLYEGNVQDVSPDGKKFLIVKPVPSPPATQINVVLNWTEELRRASSTNTKP